MQQLERSTVEAQEIDSLGHLNVRFYLERVDRAGRALFDALGVLTATLAADGARLRRVDTYSRFRREQFEGATLAVHGGLLQTARDQARCYFEIRNPEREELAATFVTGTIVADHSTRQARPLPAALAAVNEQYGVQLPDYGAPRSLNLDPPNTTVALAELAARVPESTEFGMTGRREGLIEDADCGADGVLRDDVELMFVLFRRQLEQNQNQDQGQAMGPPVLRTDEGHRFSWAMLETRSVDIASPRSGDKVVWIGADVAIGAKHRHSRRWAFVERTGQLLSIHDAVGIAMDLDARRAIAIPASIRAGMEAHFLPDYL